MLRSVLTPSSAVFARRAPLVARRLPLFQAQATRSYARYQYQYQRFNNQNQRSFTQLLFDPVGRKYLGIALGSGMLFYFANREEAPVSGRMRFIWVPRWLEVKIGNYTYKSILRETEGTILSERHPVTKKVEKVFSRIVEAAYKDPSIDNSQLEGVQWRIHVVNDPTQPPNAFVLPGGKVFVFSSILNICQNEDGLATVLSHEFAHQLARHTAENLSKAPAYAIVSLLLYSITGIHGLDNLLTDGLLRMPASRQMETEADFIGLMIMARACFNPPEAISLWERMADFERRSNMGTGSVEFLSTHPASERRIENMKHWMPQADNLYNESDCSAVNRYYKGFQDTMFGATMATVSPPSSPFAGF